jgi:hypothetical protein
VTPRARGVRFALRSAAALAALALGVVAYALSLVLVAACWELARASLAP